MLELLYSLSFEGFMEIGFIIGFLFAAVGFDKLFILILKLPMALGEGKGIFSYFLVPITVGGDAVTNCLLLESYVFVTILNCLVAGS